MSLSTRSEGRSSLLTLGSLVLSLCHFARTRTRLLRYGIVRQRSCSARSSTHALSTCGPWVRSSQRWSQAIRYSRATLRSTRSSRSSGCWAHQTKLSGRVFHSCRTTRLTSRSGIPNSCARWCRTPIVSTMRGSTSSHRCLRTRPIRALWQRMPSSIRTSTVLTRARSAPFRCPSSGGCAHVMGASSALVAAPPLPVLGYSKALWLALGAFARQSC
mmetsp:Transcript_30503/g.76165  ORF Transcript_30503/g.76165 Transcript_30503/m.76165 type:complete len:216 (-) Transcript_30503:270-917(-)